MGSSWVSESSGVTAEGYWLHSDHAFYKDHAGQTVHPIRQVYRDLLSNHVSFWTLVLVPTALLCIFWGTRLFMRACFWALDRVRDARAAEDTVIFAPFQDKDFWEAEYANKRGEFEWYATFKDLKEILLGNIRTGGRLLHIGCGTSSLARDLYHHGVTDIVNIDVSKGAIELAMSQAAADRRGPAEMDFQLVDCRRMNAFPTSSFHTALDKGTLDSISCDKEHGEDNVAQMLAEVHRVLRPGGVFVFVTTVGSGTIARFLQDSGLEQVSVTRIVTKMSRRRVPLLPNSVYVLRKPVDSVVDVGGTGGGGRGAAGDAKGAPVSAGGGSGGGGGGGGASWDASMSEGAAKTGDTLRRHRDHTE